MASVEEASGPRPSVPASRSKASSGFAKTVTNTVQAGAEGAQTAVRTMQEAVQTSLSTTSELARLSTDRAMQLFNPRTADAQSLATRPREPASRRTSRHGSGPRRPGCFPRVV
jgi:hypothetical protein